MCCLFVCLGTDIRACKSALHRADESLFGGMMRRLLCWGLFVLALGVSGCAQNASMITPRQAVEKAADAAPAAVKGVFDMQVRSSGEQDGYLYLNSEEDYRDQRNLTVAIRPGLDVALQTRFGAAPATYFKGKHIRVTGVAQRVKIWFFCQGKQTEKYYYQTHVELEDAGQIKIVP